MKISNFKLVSVCGKNALNWRFKATVDVTDKMGFFSVKRLRLNKSIWFLVQIGTLLILVTLLLFAKLRI
jgi:hypothetical protein